MSNNSASARKRSSSRCRRHARAVHLRRCEWRDRVRLRHAAGELRCGVIPLRSSCTAARRFRSAISGAIAGTRRRTRVRVTRASSSISMARPAAARRSRIRSAATGAAAARRPAEGPRRGAGKVSVAGRKPHVRARRLLRRPHDQLDRRVMQILGAPMPIKAIAT